MIQPEINHSASFKEKPAVATSPAIRVVMSIPNALDRKYPNAPRDWRWQLVFPQEKRWKNTKTGEQGRHHVHETLLLAGL